MAKARLKRIEIVGFRSFGQSAQSFEPPETLAVVWGSNSQGKTSLAEAVEFLFSGQIVRRELMASTKDEFAEALRNAHIGSACPTRVDAEILCADGQVRKLSRTLVEDYKRNSASGCVSKLMIDGVSASEADIRDRLGIVLSHPPLIAPVLTQHTLAYIFSAAPAERSAYFRALLDTQDLEEFRVAVSRLAETIPTPKDQFLDKLTALEPISTIKAQLAKLRTSTSQKEVERHLAEALVAMLGEAGIATVELLDGNAELFRQELERRRSQTFPLELLKRGQPILLAQLGGDIPNVEAFLAEREKVDAEAKRLLALFSAALDIHDHPEGSADCSLCGTPGALTPARIEFIKERVEAASDYSRTHTEYEEALRSLQSRASAAFGSVRQALPEFQRIPAAERESRGFSVPRIRELVANDALVDAWLDKFWDLVSAVIPLASRFRRIANHCEQGLTDPDAWSDLSGLKQALADVEMFQQHLTSLEPTYLAAVQPVFEQLKQAVDQSTATAGWEALLDCALAPAAVFDAIAAATEQAAIIKSLQMAHGEIEKAIGKVADEKFSELSDDVRVWWDRLRPDEPTFFDGVKRRSAVSRRNVDLRVGLAAKEDRSDAKFRDAVAVLSQSQLHCLGLSLFIARAVKEGAGFIVLDDPVLTSDDDYRPNFASSVIEGLLDAGIQTIVATQDYKTWKEMGDRWDYRNIAQLQLVRSDPIEGTEIRNQNDDLATMIARAVPLVSSEDPMQRKEGATRLREAIERFGKMVLVKDRKAKGDNNAAVTDYDGKDFGNYSAQVYALLVQDGGHPGKLKTAHKNATPGPHDDKPPSKGELKHAMGDLRKLKKDYLG